MGRSWILLRFGALLCYFAGGLAVFVDAKFSQDWIQQVTRSNAIMPGLSMGIAFIMATCVSAFGAIVTAPFSWQIIFAQSQRLAAISNKHERLLTLLGFSLLGGFLLIAFVTCYAFDIISTNHATKNLILAIVIVCAGDVCFLLANVLWIMSKFALATAGDVNRVTSHGQQTVAAPGSGRFK